MGNSARNAKLLRNSKLCFVLTWCVQKRLAVEQVPLANRFGTVARWTFRSAAASLLGFDVLEVEPRLDALGETHFKRKQL